MNQNIQFALVIFAILNGFPQANCQQDVEFYRPFYNTPFLQPVYGFGNLLGSRGGRAFTFTDANADEGSIPLRNPYLRQRNKQVASSGSYVSRPLVPGLQYGSVSGSSSTATGTQTGISSTTGQYNIVVPVPSSLQYQFQNPNPNPNNNNPVTYNWRF